LFNPLALCNACATSCGEMCKLPVDTAYVLAKYGHSCAALFGFFPHPPTSAIMFLSSEW